MISVEWQTPEPERDRAWWRRLVAALSPSPDDDADLVTATRPSSSADPLPLGPDARLLVVAAGERRDPAGGASRPSRDRSLAIRDDGAVPPPTSAGPLRLVAVAWACVDEGRARTLAGEDAVPFSEPVLGADGFRTDTDPALVACYAVTEARLAAALARGGEGPVALYLAVGDTAVTEVEQRLASASVVTIRDRGGPFGPAVLVRPDRSWGPFLVFVAPPDAPAAPSAGYG
jgi:hypothetical protein